MTDIIKRIEDALENVDQELLALSQTDYNDSVISHNQTIQAVLTAVLKMHRGELDGLWLDDLDKHSFMQEIERQLDD